jgi:hypothetical protein
LAQAIRWKTFSKVFDEWVRQCADGITADEDCFEWAFKWCVRAAGIMTSPGDTILGVAHPVCLIEFSKACSDYSLTRVLTCVGMTTIEILPRYRNSWWVLVLPQYQRRVYLIPAELKDFEQRETDSLIWNSYTNDNLQFYELSSD